ncbi:hypothetical protein Asp14428_33470 [Actinoplanes sp. NBRC 14428]|nr:hypothetical protein Asp14428_33470 [Actinoplanes sp. NBRC 14428]
MGVDWVGLAALAGGEHPGAGGQLRGHVEDGFSVGDQALGDVPADAIAAFDRPDAVGVFTAGGEHCLVSVAVGAEAALADGLLARFMISMVADRLCGSTPMTTRATAVPPGSDDNVGGRATLL